MLGAGLGWAMWLSCHGPPPVRHEVDYYLPFLKCSEDAHCVPTLSARKNNEYARGGKKKESNYVSFEVVINKTLGPVTRW